MMMRRGFNASHRAMSTFCWLPPERAPMEASGPLILMLTSEAAAKAACRTLFSLSIHPPEKRSIPAMQMLNFTSR